MDKRFFTNLGNDIKKATESKDFSQLGQNISDTVNQTVNDVLNSVQDAMKQVSAGPKVTVLPKENAEKKPQWNYAHPMRKSRFRSGRHLLSPKKAGVCRISPICPEPFYR